MTERFSEAKRRYLLKFDEINRLGQVFADVAVGESATKKNVKAAVDEFYDILIDAYIEGFAFAAYLLGEDDVENGIDEEKMRKAVEYSYPDGSIESKFIAYFLSGDGEAIKRLLESEFHRVHQTGGFDYADSLPIPPMKRWITMRDERVRDAHRYLEGVTVPYDAEFISYDGDSAQFPGGFKNPALNAGCRCVVVYEQI